MLPVLFFSKCDNLQHQFRDVTPQVPGHTAERTLPGLGLSHDRQEIQLLPEKVMDQWELLATKL